MAESDALDMYLVIGLEWPEDEGLRLPARGRMGGALLEVPAGVDLGGRRRRLPPRAALLPGTFPSASGSSQS